MGDNRAAAFAPQDGMIWAAAVFAGALALLAPAMANGFPFMFIDSADYIILTPRLFRSPFYQIFVFATGWKTSIWLVAIAQSLIVAYLIALVMRAERVDGRRALVALPVLALLSSASVFVGFIMPDIFTGVMFLAIYLLAFRFDALGRFERIIVTGLACLSIVVHLSHLTMAAAIVAFAIILRRLLPAARSAFAGILAASGAIAAAALAISSYNLAVFGSFALAPAGSSFLLANLIEHGPARAELTRTCPRAGYRLCAYVDKLPKTANQFLWRPGPFLELGGFGGMKDEAGRIVEATLKHQAPAVVSSSAQNFARALVTFDASNDIHPLAGAGADTAQRISALVGDVYGPDAREEAVLSLQARDAWPVASLNALHAVILVLALLAIGLGLIRKRIAPSIMPMTIFMVTAFAGNALVCSALSGVHARYQGRLSWLLVLVAIIFFLTARRGERDAPALGD